MKYTPKQMSDYLWEGVRHEKTPKSTKPHNNQPQPTEGHQNVATPTLERRREDNQG